MSINSLNLKPMKVTLIAIAMLVFTVSLKAQGLTSQNLNTGEVVSGELNIVTATDLTLLDSTSQLIQANRGIDQPFAPSLPPTPIADPSSDFQPQVSSLTIQAVPEPSSIALGSLAIGVIAWMRLSKRQQISKN